MEVRYDNGYFKVVANPYEDCYYVVNKHTGIADGKETSEVRAKFSADGMRDATIKHNENRGTEEVNA